MHTHTYTHTRVHLTINKLKTF